MCVCFIRSVLLSLYKYPVHYLLLIKTNYNTMSMEIFTGESSSSNFFHGNLQCIKYMKDILEDRRLRWVVSQIRNDVWVVGDGIVPALGFAGDDLRQRNQTKALARGLTPPVAFMAPATKEIWDQDQYLGRTIANPVGDNGGSKGPAGKSLLLLPLDMVTLIVSARTAASTERLMGMISFFALLSQKAGKEEIKFLQDLEESSSADISKVCCCNILYLVCAVPIPY